MEIMPTISSESVDLILCDLPYELNNWTNPMRWDRMLPIDAMMHEYWRLIKKNHPIILFCNEPNATRLRMSAMDKFKYNLIWVKTKVGGVMNAKVRPLKVHETILVFSEGTTSPGRTNNMPYYPQGLVEVNKTVRNSKKDRSVFSDRPSIQESYVQEFTNYPTDVLVFNSVHKGKHPTEKPVALLEYLVRTYSRESDTILDNCMGHGTTGVACLNTKRDFIGIEQDAAYFEMAQRRLDACSVQASIFA